MGIDATDCDRSTISTDGSRWRFRSRSNQFDRQNTLVSCDREKCSEKFKVRADLQQHINKNHKDFPCSSCDKTFTNGKDYVEHVEKDNFGMYEYSICERVYKTCHSLFNHKKYAHNKVGKGKKFVCTFCDKGFYEKLDFIAHSIRMHEDDGTGRVDCPLCHKRVHSNSIKRHLQTQHQSEVKQ